MVYWRLLSACTAATLPRQARQERQTIRRSAQDVCFKWFLAVLSCSHLSRWVWFMAPCGDKAGGQDWHVVVVILDPVLTGWFLWWDWFISLVDPVDSLNTKSAQSYCCLGLKFTELNYNFSLKKNLCACFVIKVIFYLLLTAARF